MFKTQLNWAGNKYKYLDIIQGAIKNKKFKTVIDPFFGSGNLALNVALLVNPERVIGSDILPLPSLFFKEVYKHSDYNIDELNIIIDKWNRFTDKTDYYSFRDYWNEKFMNDKIDKDFVYETLMLMKMCSNSMVRFNNSGAFNQGFRGLTPAKQSSGNGFFGERTKKSIITGLGELLTVKFNSLELYSKDYKEIIEMQNDGDTLLLIDPPYLLATGMYNADTYNQEKEEWLINYLKNDFKGKFIYFNFLQKGNVKLEIVEKLAEGNKVILLSDKTGTGQNRIDTTEVKEVLITNIKEVE